MTRIISAKRLSEPWARGMTQRRGHGLSQCYRRTGQSDSLRDRTAESHLGNGAARVDEDLVLLHADVAIPESHGGVRAVHDARGDGPVTSPEHGVPRGGAIDEHADQRLHRPPRNRLGRRTGRPDGLPRLHRTDDWTLSEGPWKQIQAVCTRLPRRTVFPHREHEQHAETNVLLLQDAPRQRTDVPGGHGAERGWREPNPRERRVPRRWDRHARPGSLPREARPVPPSREDALRRALHGETRDRDPERWHHRDGSDLRSRRECAPARRSLSRKNKPLMRGIGNSIRRNSRFSQRKTSLSPASRSFQGGSSRS